VNKIQILANSYPIESLLEQNDVEEQTVITWLVEEGFLDLDDYFGFEDELVGEDD